MKKISISGSSFAIGQALGAFGREAWHHKLTQTVLWQTVMALQDTPHANEMRQRVQEHYPLIWQELQGLAEGLAAPLSQVFAWNCRGDLVRSTSDGCTTLAGITPGGECIMAHNEDGFPQLRTDCALVDVKPDTGLAFTSFAYPGSICGHTFAINEKGLVNTVNNIRAIERPSGVPRQVLARAALNAGTLEEALDILTGPSRAGAFHHTLAQKGDNRIFSVEATGSGCSIREISVGMGHANHLIHAESAEVLQVITASSASRQETLNAWLATKPDFSELNVRDVLSCRLPATLPVYRLAADDPDEENTLATAIFILSNTGVRWEVFGLDRKQAEQSGRI